jgi:hypothetical protein
MEFWMLIEPKTNKKQSLQLGCKPCGKWLEKWIVAASSQSNYSTVVCLAKAELTPYCRSPESVAFTHCEVNAALVSSRIQLTIGGSMMLFPQNLCIIRNDFYVGS